MNLLATKDIIAIFKKFTFIVASYNYRDYYIDWLAEPTQGIRLIYKYN